MLSKEHYCYKILTLLMKSSVYAPFDRNLPLPPISITHPAPVPIFTRKPWASILFVWFLKNLTFLINKLCYSHHVIIHTMLLANLWNFWNILILFHWDCSIIFHWIWKTFTHKPFVIPHKPGGIIKSPSPYSSSLSKSKHLVGLELESFWFDQNAFTHWW